MTSKVRKQIAAKIALIESGRFDVDDVKLLFIDIRDSLDCLDNYDKTDLLYDIFNFCAHPNARERGAIFRNARDKLKNEIIPFVMKGGTLGSTPLDFNVILSLLSMLEALGIKSDIKRISQQNKKMTKIVYKILKDTPLKIDDEYLQSGEVIYNTELDAPFINFKMKHIKHTNSETNFTFEGNPIFSFRII